MWEISPFSSQLPLPAPLFNPLTLITGNGGFWEADKGVTLSGANVTNWADQSSFANNLTAGGGNPTFSSTGFNSSFAGIAFADNSGAQLANSAINYNSATTTVFFLIQYASGNTLANGRFVGFRASSGQADFAGANSFATFDGAPGSFRCFNSNAEQGNGGSAGPTLTANGLFLLGIVFDGANSNKWTAGAVLGSGTAMTNNIGLGTGGELDVGTTTSANAAGCTYAFVGLTQKAMNSTDWTNLKGYSNAVWGTSF